MKIEIPFNSLTLAAGFSLLLSTFTAVMHCEKQDCFLKGATLIGDAFDRAVYSEQTQSALRIINMDNKALTIVRGAPDRLDYVDKQTAPYRERILHFEQRI